MSLGSFLIISCFIIVTIVIAAIQSNDQPDRKMKSNYEVHDPFFQEQFQCDHHEQKCLFLENMQRDLNEQNQLMQVAQRIQEEQNQLFLREQNRLFQEQMQRVQEEQQRQLDLQNQLMNQQFMYPFI